MSIDDERIAHELSLLGGPEEEAAVRFLCAAGPSALPALQAAFAREQRAEVRSTILRVVREIGDPSSLPFLVSLVGDADQDIWGQAVDGIAARGSAEALEALRSLREEVPGHTLKRQWIDEAICRVKEARQGKGEREALPKAATSPWAWDRRKTLTCLAIGLSILSVLVCGWYVHGSEQRSRHWIYELPLKVIVEAAEKVRRETGKAPQSLEELARVTHSEEFRHQFENRGPLDLWDRPYLYELVEGAPVARTLGADGRPGGDEGDRDYVWPPAPVPLGEYLKSPEFIRTLRIAAATGLVMGLLWYVTHRRTPVRPPTVDNLVFEGFQLGWVLVVATIAGHFIILLHVYPHH